MNIAQNRLNDSLALARAEHSWLAPDSLADAWLIGNPDLDGLLCLALIQSLSPTVHLAGFYSGEQLILTPEAHDFVQDQGLESLKAIECDLYLMPSLGQHFTLAASAYPHLNPNLVRGFNEAANFRRKYPLNTLVFLWKWFELDFPTGQRREKCLRAMFYPDGVLLKVLSRYFENAQDWLNWLGLEVETRELLGIASQDETVQLARCIYKEFGNTQIGLTFTSQSGRIVLSNAARALDWVNWFANQLGITALSLPQVYLSVESFVQHRANPALELRQLDQTRCFLQGTKIVSDALVRAQEWSVTLVEDNRGVLGARGLPSGLSREPSQWIEQLHLNDRCRLRVGPCRRRNCGVNY